MTLSPAQLGIVRGLGVALLMSVLTYFGDAAHLNNVVSPLIAALVSSLALSLENHLSAKGDTALFGAVTRT